MDFLKEFLSRSGISLKKYIKAKLISIIVSFIIIALGLYIGKIPYFILIALIISIIDILPILGSGIVFIPWAIIELLNNDKNLAIILIITYVATFIARQVLEPIILGKSVGVRPLYSILIMLGSMILFTPVVGAIVGAVVTVLLGVYLEMTYKKS